MPPRIEYLVIQEEALIVSLQPAQTASTCQRQIPSLGASYQPTCSAKSNIQEQSKAPNVHVWTPAALDTFRGIAQAQRRESEHSGSRCCQHSIQCPIPRCSIVNIVRVILTHPCRLGAALVPAAREPLKVGIAASGNSTFFFFPRFPPCS